MFNILYCKAMLSVLVEKF